MTDQPARSSWVRYLFLPPVASLTLHNRTFIRFSQSGRTGGGGGGGAAFMVSVVAAAEAFARALGGEHEAAFQNISVI